MWSPVSTKRCAMMLLKFCALSLFVLPCTAHASNGKKAFVLLGATGDNAYRPSGFWTGLFEAWCTGIFDQKPKVDLHVQINQGHTVDEIKAKVMNTLDPFFESLQQDASWKCSAPNGDCSPDVFFSIGQMNIWEGIGRYNSSGQAANMSYLAEYDEVIAYMNLPPSAYSEWALAMVKYWGGGSKMHVAVEKPFGGGRNSLQDATDLYNSIMASGLPPTSLHLTDHWLSFFMVRQLHTFRQIVEPLLGLEWSGKDIKKIVITEYEERGFGGRGSFIDGLGQVRDMVQSHLLQVLALTLRDLDSRNVKDAKLDLFNSMTLGACEPWQFDGLLESRYMKFHSDFADSSFVRVHLDSSSDAWKDVELVIQTGKAMDVNLYTIDVYQRGGQGVLTFDIGKEEVGVGDIKVTNWPLKSSSPFQAPIPGFHSSSTFTASPRVSAGGNGTILAYANSSLYFPKPYATIAVSLITADYQDAFVTWPECHKCWEIVTSHSPQQCLDPPPENVNVYLPAFMCDKTAPQMCDQHETVKDKYESKYSCTAEHDVWYKDVDLYKAKCHPSSRSSLLESAVHASGPTVLV